MARLEPADGDGPATPAEIGSARPTGEVPDDGAARRLTERLARVLAERRRTLQRRFGWAGPALRCTVEPRRRTLAIAGEALSSRTLTAAIAELQAALPSGWTIDAAATEIAAPREWFALPAGVTRLWRAPPVGVFSNEVYVGTCASAHVLEDMRRVARERRSAGDLRDAAGPGRGDGAGRGPTARGGTRAEERGAAGGRRGGCFEGHVRGGSEGGAAGDGWCLSGHVREDRNVGASRNDRVGWCPEGHVREDDELCTELLAGDGLVGVLAAAGEWALVRARDGTIGWTRARLGSPAAAPMPMTVQGGAAALARALRRFRGAPYRLGGTTSLGIDCSGLVQRAVRSALGVVLPRHSSDQLGLAAAPVRALGEPGDSAVPVGRRRVVVSRGRGAPRRASGGPHAASRVVAPRQGDRGAARGSAAAGGAMAARGARAGAGAAAMTATARGGTCDWCGAVRRDVGSAACRLRHPHSPDRMLHGACPVEHAQKDTWPDGRGRGDARSGGRGGSSRVGVA
ncbi:NlpC/P60 family protein [Nannocystis pusilla]|uniref:NlpC/P60 family protein n=1 Tax=Nannocystis pusilla TaxID=889268 RepID=UPI003DA5AD30